MAMDPVLVCESRKVPPYLGKEGCASGWEETGWVVRAGRGGCCSAAVIICGVLLKPRAHFESLLSVVKG